MGFGLPLVRGDQHNALEVAEQPDLASQSDDEDALIEAYYLIAS
jgi:hypothetical protein